MAQYQAAVEFSEKQKPDSNTCLSHALNNLLAAPFVPPRATNLEGVMYFIVPPHQSN